MAATANIKTNALIKLIEKAIADKKGEDPIVIKVGKHCSYTDFLVVAAGNSARQLQAIGDEILKTAKRKPLSVEGYQLGEWILIDFGEVVVHLFQPAQRMLYSIEKLWQGNIPKEGPKVVDEELRQMKKVHRSVQ